MKLGIVGLPNVGKSTLFNALTKAGAESANYPFCTIDPNVGVVAVPDERLKLLSDFYASKKITPAVIEFVDIAGLVKGASKGEGLGNQFLANIREVDAILHVVRCFEDTNIVHVDGSVDPVRDAETIEFELIFADLEVIEKRLQKIGKNVSGNKDAKIEADVLNGLKAHLESGKRALSFDAGSDELNAIADSFSLLTRKPMIYAANVSEDDVSDDGEKNPHVQALKAYAEKEGAPLFVVSAELEAEIADFEEEEKQLFLQDLGVRETALKRLIQASYSILGLTSYLTAGEKETRAWTIKKGTKAPEAAGKIHSDFERGFIKAEVVNYQDLLDAGSYAGAREKGLVRMEGKEYVVQDGDVILFRFNV